MSIAVSAVVRPSLCLRLTLAVFWLFALGFTLMLGLRQHAYFWPWAGFGASLLATLVLPYSLLKNRNSHRIDISGVGQIRLTVYQVMPAGGMCAGDIPTLVTLTSGSTLWPALLLLHLRAADGAIVVLPVLPDSVSSGLFRPLSVACRTIAARNDDLT